VRITTNGRWLRIAIAETKDQPGDHVVVPEVAYWVAPIGERGCSVLVTVDFSHGHPRITQIELNGDDITSAERKLVARLSTDQVVKDVLQAYGRRIDDQASASFMQQGRADLMTDDYVHGYTNENPAVQASVRSRRAAKQALLTAVAEAWETTGEDDPLEDRYELVQKVLKQLGRGSSYRSAQQAVTEARQAGLIDVQDVEPPAWFTTDRDFGRAVR
jgi:hypothetical protein